MTGWYRDLDANGRRAFCSSYAGFSVDAMNIQVYAFILPVLLTLWDMSPSSAGFLATIALLSGAAGGWLAGCLSDRIGRVRVLCITILWLGLSSALCGLAGNYEQLVAARALQGFGFGAEWAVGAVFIGEIAPPKSRGRILGTLQSAWGTGWALAAAVTSITLALLPPDIGWRATFFVGLIPALLIFRTRLRLSESPAFLASGTPNAWHEIFARGMRGRTAKGSLLAIGTHGGYWAIATWWPTMLRLERGMSEGEAAIHLAVLIGGSFAGYALGAWLSDRIGRRATLTSFALGGIAVVLAATYLPLPDPALLAMSAPLGLFALGIYSAVSPALTELYPTRLRGSGLGFCYNVGRGIAGVTPLAIGSSVGAFGLSHAIGLYVSAAYALILVAAALLPETRGTEFSGLAAESIT